MTRRLLAAGCSLLCLSGAAAAQETGVFGDNGQAARIDVMTPRGAPRPISFDTDVGTDLSVDVSPDGRWIVFDLLGHIYRMPSSGGSAECLTQGSGIALNQHPRFSPDGRSIAFVSDRSGQLNVWTMRADGSAPRIVFADIDNRWYDPAWSPDGTSIVAVRGQSTPGRAWHRRNASIWQLPLDGTAPAPLLAGTLQQYYAPEFSRDGAYLYFHTAVMAFRGLSIVQTGFRVLRRDMRSGAVEELPGRAAPPPAQERPVQDAWSANFGDVDGGTPAEFEPHLSPDGTMLAFGRAAPDTGMKMRGHAYRPATELVVRDLRSGREHVVAPRITKDLHNMHAIYAETQLPGFAWSADSKSVLLAIDGKVRRVEIASGRQHDVPFRVHVQRLISEQVRGHRQIDDRSLQVRFLQFPATTADRKRQAFVAAGQVWVVAAPGMQPQAIALPIGPSFATTPSWSPDGEELAFASWDNRNGGALWIYRADTGAVRKVTGGAGAYLHPVWSADGTALFHVARNDLAPGADPRTNPWTVEGDWRIRRLDVATGRSDEVAAMTQLGPIARGPGDRISFAEQKNPKAAEDLYAPYPSDEALQETYRLRTVDASGGAPTPSLQFPPRLPYRANMPVLSQDGHWVAFQSDHRIYVERADGAALDGNGIVDTDPDHRPAARRRVDRDGGTSPRWTGAHVLEFAAGNRLVRYDAETDETSETEISLSLPRAIPTGTVALTGATLITLEDGAPAKQMGDLLIDGARIACVGKCDLRRADRVIDMRGTFILPGLIDVHSHIFSEPTPVIPTYRPDSAIALAYGVTTAVDPAVESESLFPIGDMTETAQILGPRSLGTGEVVIDSRAPDGAMSTGMGDVVTIRTPEDAAFQVQRRVQWGAISIKNFRQNRREQHQLLLDAARKANVSVTGEGGSASFDLTLAMDGQTGWEHPIPSLPLHADLAQFLGRARVTYSPTLNIAGHLAGANAYFRPRSNLATDARVTRFVPAASIREALDRTPTLVAKNRFSFPILAEGLADIVRAGGYGALGEHGEQPGPGSHWELWSYAEALTPLEALRVATIDGARFVGLEDELGTIRTGKIADLVVLNRDPLQNIRVTTDIRYVMKAGSLYDANDLRPTWTAPWVAAQIERLRAVTTPPATTK